MKYSKEPLQKTERSSICETAKLPTERLCRRTFCKRMLKPIICCPIPMRIRWTRNRKAVCLHPVRPGAGYTQLELSVVAANTRAIALYQKAGLVEFGRNPRGFRSRTSGFQEIVFMRLEL